ncbi:hypothetical protein N8T08_009499 [Aspergillus melleus]|uniref:Uncharacterized protein n=1 Tax=Aspergillus melleus TaxID=138277 RepID=A0ACC3BD77_9EURO|nr:hypothetical protein N8T08_009499 [Aspergillus melleus]
MTHAAGEGHLPVCKTLFEYGADLQINTRWNRANALVRAASGGHFSVVKFLIEAVGDYTEYEETVYSCLREAAAAGHVEILRYLFDLSGGIDERRFYNNLLELASGGGHLTIVEFLLSECDVTTTKTQKNILHSLHVAAASQYQAVVGLLRGVLDIRSIIEYESLASQACQRLFSISAMCGWADILQELLQRGCSPELIPNRHLNDKYEWTALALAAKRGHLGVVELLLDHKADVNRPPVLRSSYPSRTRDPPIRLAAIHGHKDIVEKLLYHGANPNPKRSRNSKLFAYDGVRSPEIMSLLLNWGADPSLGLRYEAKPCRCVLSDALVNGSNEMVKMLLGRGITLMPYPRWDKEPLRMTQTARPARQDTLFTIAANNGVHMVEFILEQGYTVTPGSSEVSMALDSALFRADVALVNLFCEAGFLGDLVMSPYENIFGSIMSVRRDFEAAATIMDVLLAQGFEIRNDLEYVRKEIRHGGYFGEHSGWCAMYQMLFDRGANPLAGSGPETELSFMAQIGDKKVVQMMLETLDQLRMEQGDLQQKLAFAQEQAREANHLDIVRALDRAYWRTVYPIPKET